MNTPPPIKGPRQLIENAMQTYLVAISDALRVAGNPAHFLTVSTNIALPNGECFTLTANLKAKAPEPTEPVPSLYGTDGNPIVWDKTKKPS